jgi:hypothetical protein
MGDDFMWVGHSALLYTISHFSLLSLPHQSLSAPPNDQDYVIEFGNPPRVARNRLITSSGKINTDTSDIPVIPTAIIIARQHVVSQKVGLLYSKEEQGRVRVA